MIRIHNSLTGAKQELEPITPGELSMYVCGLTVYDFVHIGHARMLTVFDVVTRYLRHRGLRLRYVRNITDIDDKIIRRAAENGEPIDALTARFIEAMHTDCAALGILPPDAEPRATQYVPQIIAMVRELLARDYAYVAADGDVLYAVARFAGYGRLSGKRLGDLRAGARVEVDEAKRDPLDFVLWKRAKPGEPCWDSPWGPGRPGWHIECSAMSTALLGNHFDLHGGGLDLKFPAPRERDRAVVRGDRRGVRERVDAQRLRQCRRGEDVQVARQLLHAARSAEDAQAPGSAALLLLSSHYRGPINYAPEQLTQADAALGRLYTALRDLPPAAAAPGAHTQRFLAVMDEDFNTPEALAVLQTLAGEVNAARDAGDGMRAAQLAAELTSLGAVLGLLGVPPPEWFRLATPGVAQLAGAASGQGAVHGALERAPLSDSEIEARIAARVAARRGKDWAESDRIRDQLAAAGVILEDQPGGKTTWRRA